MKAFYLLFLLYFCITASARDSMEVIPRETSFENYDLLIVAAVGLALLIAFYFLWRQRKK